MNAVAPSQPPSGRASQPVSSLPRRVNVHGVLLPTGLVRGLLALILVGTLLFSLFVSPPSSMATLMTALETLVLTIIGFYFGSRATKRPRPTTKPTPELSTPHATAEPSKPQGLVG
jgi:drug/metabolite transporter (DMT)-like permease